MGPTSQPFQATKFWKLNKLIIHKLPGGGNPILILGYYISVATIGFLLDDVILLESLDMHSGSNTNSLHTDIIYLYIII